MTERGPVLEVRDLTVEVRVGGSWLPVVDDLSLDVGRNEILGLRVTFRSDRPPLRSGSGSLVLAPLGRSSLTRLRCGGIGS
jgi:ABC-type antimicrobial peptide transport system ATPase subunit